MVRVQPGTLRPVRGTALDVDHQLRDINAAAISATTVETGVEVAGIQKSAFKCIIEHQDFSGGTWDLTFEAATDVAFTAPVTLAIESLTTTGRELEIAFTGNELWTRLGGPFATDSPDYVFIRVTATIGGTPTDLTYGAWLTPMDK